MQFANIQIADDHPAFAGHFPGSPIVPGAVLLDEILHAISVGAGIPAGRCKIRSAKFKRIVTPGRPLELSFEFTGPATVRFELKSAADLIADGVVLLGAAS